MFTQLSYHLGGEQCALSDRIDLFNGHPVVIGECALYRHRKKDQLDWAVLLRIKDVVHCCYGGDGDSPYIKVILEVENMPPGYLVGDGKATCARAPTTEDERWAIISDSPWCDLWEC